MTAQIGELLEALAARSHEQRLPATMSGVVRLDVDDAGRIEQWFITMRKGDVTAGREGGEAECVVRGDAATFAAVLSGEANMMAAVLRGALEVEGRALLMVVFQRLTPGEDVGPDVPVAGYARRQS